MFGSGLVIVVFVLVAADPRVREGASTLMGGGPLAGLADLGMRLGGLLLIVEHVALSYGRDHSSLTLFAVVAIVLVAAVFFLL
jgi:hypothetical protein